MYSHSENVLDIEKNKEKHFFDCLLGDVPMILGVVTTVAFDAIGNDSAGLVGPLLPGFFTVG